MNWNVQVEQALKDSPVSPCARPSPSQTTPLSFARPDLSQQHHLGLSPGVQLASAE